MRKKDVLNFLVKIYALIDPRNNMPFYIGATRKNLKERLVGHIHTKENTSSGNNIKCRYIQTMRKEGFVPDIILLEEVPFKESSMVEFYYYDQLTYFG